LFEELASKDERLNLVVLIWLEGGGLLYVAPVVPHDLAPQTFSEMPVCSGGVAGGALQQRDAPLLLKILV
jgi:hypothetical protein